MVSHCERFRKLKVCGGIDIKPSSSQRQICRTFLSDETKHPTHPTGCSAVLHLNSHTLTLGLVYFFPPYHSLFLYAHAHSLDAFPSSDRPRCCCCCYYYSRFCFCFCFCCLSYTCATKQKSFVSSTDMNQREPPLHAMQYWVDSY